jgi:hypothetical protein
MRDRTPGSRLGDLARGCHRRWLNARTVGALIVAGVVLAGCGPSKGPGTTPVGGGSTNPGQTTRPPGSTDTTTPGSNTAPSSSAPTGSLDEAVVGNWVEESSEMTGACQDIDSFSFGANGTFSFAQDPENSDCAGVETFGQWRTQGNTLALDTETSNCGESCNAAYGTVDWSYEVTTLTLTLCAPGTTSGCVTYESDNSSS